MEDKVRTIYMRMTQQGNIYNAIIKHDYLTRNVSRNSTPGDLQFGLKAINKNGEMEGAATFWALIDVFLCLAIISGNILTIYAILKSKTVSRVISNRFILSLSISDLNVGFMVLYHMAFYIYPRLGDHYQFCIVRLFLLSLACTASVFNVFGIAIDRFIAVVYPFHYYKIITKSSARLISCLGWFLSCTISVIPLHWNNWTPHVKCELGLIVSPLYVLIIYLPVYTILYTGMCLLYVMIIKETRRHANRMNHLTNERRSLWKSIQVLTLVLGSFTVSYTPYVILVAVNSLMQRRMKAMSTIYRVSYSLVVANSAVNPIIYAWKNQELRKSLSNVIHCKSINSCHDLT